MFRTMNLTFRIEQQAAGFRINIPYRFATVLQRKLPNSSSTAQESDFVNISMQELAVVENR